MYPNSLKPAKGSRKVARRVGRGIGSGLGKTCGRGHKGQHARSGGFHKVGFEGGQMPLQRRLPKFGFRSHQKSGVAEIRLYQLASFPETVVSKDTLAKAKLIPVDVRKVKIVLRGFIEKALTIAADVQVTAGARSAIQAAGGTVES